MNISKKDKVKIIVALFFLFAAIMLSVFAIRNWENTAASGYSVIAALICAIIGWLLIRKYPFSKVANVFGGFVGIIFSVVGRVINGVRNILGMNNDRYMRPLNIKNFSDEEESIGDFSKKVRRSRPKFKKWKDMDGAEKVRYIYAKRNLKHIRKGYNYKDSNTPNETLEEMLSKKIENGEVKELYVNYNPARYGKNFDITEENAIKLKHKFL